MTDLFFVDDPDPTFGQAVSLLLEIPHPPRDLVPSGICGLLELAHYELTDGGRYRTTLPRRDADIGLGPDTTGQVVLQRVDDLLTQLIESSPDLATTLRYHRSRTYLRMALDDLPRFAANNVSTR